MSGGSRRPDSVLRCDHTTPSLSLISDKTANSTPPLAGGSRGQPSPSLAAGWLPSIVLTTVTTVTTI